MVTKNLSKSVLTLAAVAIVALILTSTSANAAPVLSGQLGILDMSGINPVTGVAWAKDDTYRLIFATSTGRDATATDIADYNTFVQNAANASTIGGAGVLGSVTWTALASTETVAARDNTNTNSAVDGPGESFWLLNGTSLVADNYADLYGFATHSSPINIDETGDAPFDGGDFTSVWTGSDGAGNIKTNAGGGNPGWLGNTVDPGDGVVKAHTGLWNFTSGAHWIDRFQVDANDLKGLYAVSEVLTVDIPTPAALPAGLALIGFAAARRRRMK